MQKSVIVKPERGNDELNKLLSEGWEVVAMTPGHVAKGSQSYDSVFGPILVIIEKK